MLNALEMKQQILLELKNADERIIRELYAVLNSSTIENDWSSLPLHIQNSIDEGIRQANNGDVIAHEDVMKKYKS